MPATVRFPFHTYKAKGCCKLVAMLVILLTWSCSEDKHTHQNDMSADANSLPDTISENDLYIQQLQREVLSIHDEIMPRMDDIMTLQRQIKDEIARLNTKKQAAFGQHMSQAEKQLQMIVTDLQQADEAMMQWMRNYDSKMKDKSSEARQLYLQAEKAKIIGVKERMLKSIENANRAL